ncbi:unnamed protein product [marine sediment metagenome]|uniref:Uncharacterized protein n=1 Tax=marine sediment metagenome TaxID=412755 RepID=X1MAL3_9ZZZZ
MKCCYKCGEQWTRQEQPGFKETCPGCMSYLHACVNCRLYNPSADRCSSITAECTGDRDGLNYCEEFQFRDMPNKSAHRTSSGGRQKTLGLERSGRKDEPLRKRSSAARSKFDQLFE